MLECLSRSLNIQLTRGHTCDLRGNLIGSLTEKEGTILKHAVCHVSIFGHVVCRVAEYIVCYALSKEPLSVRLASQNHEHAHRHDRCICQ